MRFFGKCAKCGSPQQWDAPTVDERPPCPGCGFKADGARIDKQDAKIEDARPSGEAATGTMWGEKE